MNRQRGLHIRRGDSAEDVPLNHEPDGAKPTLADLLLANDLPLETRCHQRGWCRGCRAHLEVGQLEALDGMTIAAPAEILTCMVRADQRADAVVRFPERSLVSARPRVGVSFSIDTPYRVNPLFPADGMRNITAAIDLGTTTVVVLLVNVATGELLARAGGLNAQVQFGDNVLTRIAHGSTAAGLAQLREIVIAKTLAPLLSEALRQADVGLDRLNGFTVAGNTTMLHLLAGENPASIGVAPFTPVFLDTTRSSCEQLGLAAKIRGLPGGLPVLLLPGLSGYVGADIAAGIIATGMAFDGNPSLLLDLGTNGEIALQRDREFFVSATAAGPAFEGSGLTSGTRAEDGAIADLAWTGSDWRIGRLGGAAASRGICGSAYLDLLAEGKRHGLLEENGRFRDAWWNALPELMRDKTGHGREIRIGPEPDAPRVSEADIARLLQAKAAIGAGVETLLARVGMSAREIGTLYLAGGFGLHLNVANAIAIGLLPGFQPDQVRVVGNSALAGAVLAAIDRDALAEMEALRTRTTIVELNQDPAFEDRYIDHLSL
ncbi:MAG TPA: ASKHA domain-containing protein [Kiritimatiellia bacterium]|nr:ASKHA domain-containing protein [Kiritimatiellia bacterium]